MKLFNQFVNERADDYLKGAAKEAGRKIKTAAKQAADEVGEIVSTGRDNSFRRDFVDLVQQIANKLAEADAVVIESVADEVVHQLNEEADCPYRQAIASLYEVDSERSEIIICDEDDNEYRVVFNGEDLTVEPLQGTPEGAEEIRSEILDRVAELSQEVQMSEAVAGLYAAFELGQQLDEKWIDFIKGASAKAKEKLKPMWDKTKKVYDEINAAGREESKSADRRRHDEKTARREENERKRKAAAKAKQEKLRDDIRAEAEKIADKAAKRIARYEKSLGKIVQHQTLKSLLKDTKLSNLQKRTILQLINKSKRKLEGK